MRNSFGTLKLPPPHSVFWDWQLEARCRVLPTATFFPAANLRGHTRQSVEEAAKAICAGCTVQSQCLGYALTSDEPYGIWGGLTAQERSQLRDRQHLPMSTPKLVIGQPSSKYAKRDSCDSTG
ncbi:WhiB family transcriptional regulator [Rhodococcus sp. PAMC28707]|nr:WhiB family transcriptional regulator [Rhodococcus sp. PAMC28705]QCB60057.1 WhiB family transcriptional regulator [Rhodococcus sp. PAMC28707]